MSSQLLEVSELWSCGDGCGTLSKTYQSLSKYAVFKSTNGQSWQNVFKTSDQINDLKSYSEKLIAVGNNGLVSYSNDGNSWETTRPSGNTLYSIFLTNE